MKKHNNTTIAAGVTPEQDRGFRGRSSTVFDFKSAYVEMKKNGNDSSDEYDHSDDENEKEPPVAITTDVVVETPSPVPKRTHRLEIVPQSAVKRIKDTDDDTITAAEAKKYVKRYKDEETIESTWNSLAIPASGVRCSLPFTSLDDIHMLEKQVPVYLNPKNKQGGTDYGWNGYQEQHVATCRHLGWETSFGDIRRDTKSIKYRFQNINPFDTKNKCKKDTPKRIVSFKLYRPDLFPKKKNMKE